MSFGSLKHTQVLAEGTEAGAEEPSRPASCLQSISKSMPGWGQAWNGSHSQQVQGGQAEEGTHDRDGAGCAHSWALGKMLASL